MEIVSILDQGGCAVDEVVLIKGVGRDWTLFREVGIRDDANSLLSDLRTENTVLKFEGIFEEMFVEK